MMPADRKTQPPTTEATKVAPTAAAASGQACLKRRNRGRDLSKAKAYRPKDIYELYGIHDSTLCALCNDPDKTKRPPSIKLPGRNGRRGTRYFEPDKFDAWFKQYRC